MTVTLLHGNCLDLLPTLADASLDACVCDPPYELGFMGRAWDRTGIAYSVDLWREVYRVLKPGAHLTAFGGTRTVHRIACAIEDAGFEIRDQLDWIYGQGFPKSHDVSKALDKAAGAERAVVGKSARHGGGLNDKYAQDAWTRAHAATMGMSITAPATDLAAQWAGWGTSLKPAHEPIVLARKPLIGTVAANVAAYGTGAINVDACRVATDPADADAMARCNTPGSGRMYASAPPIGTFVRSKASGPLNTTAGRWPPNLLLSHAPTCVPMGTRQIRPTGGNVKTRYPETNGYEGGWGARQSAGYAADGYETVDAWECAPECPVAELDRQSGERESRPGKTKASGRGVTFVGGWQPQLDGARYPGDTGGASRFFPIFSPDPTDTASYRYVPKASRRERNAGCAGLPERAAGVHDDDAYVWPLNGDGSPRGKKVAPRANHHPTVKPVALLLWLTRLITPPGGTVLDPFMGSGSEGIACVQGGFSYVGIEREADYLPIAQARCAAAQAAPVQAALLEVTP